jgi:hypothetical protein
VSFPPFDFAQDRLRRESSLWLLDSGSRPAALPGMTGCHEGTVRIEDFVSERRREESLLTAAPAQRFFTPRSLP